MVKRQLGAFGSLAQRLVQCLHPAPCISALGEPEQTAFGLLDDSHGAVLMLQPGLIRLPQDLLTQRDQLAAHIQVIDCAAVILGIADRNHAGGKIGQIYSAPDMLKVAVLLEIIFQGDRPSHQAALGQLDNCLVQALMHGNMKMERAKKIADPL
jgi:hypothetical protein